MSQNVLFALNSEVYQYMKALLNMFIDVSFIHELIYPVFLRGCCVPCMFLEAGGSVVKSGDLELQCSVHICTIAVFCSVTW